jgi:hypothetical protein
MSFLRRLLGGEPRTPDAAQGPAPSAADLVAEEQARERELLRADAERLDDDLIQRQMRYADRSWTPPAQGTERRSDDEDAEAE